MIPKNQKPHPRKTSYGRMLSIAAAIVCMAFLSPPRPSLACTDFMLPHIGSDFKPCPQCEFFYADVSARTMDFGINLDYYLQRVNGGTKMASYAAAVGRPVEWTTRIPFVGISASPMMVLDVNPGEYFEGMNAQGLSAGLLWLERTLKDGSSYPDPVADGARNLSIRYVVSYVLGQFGTVEEAIADLSRPDGPVVFRHDLMALWWPIDLPLHLVLHDAAGDTAIVEWYDRQIHIHKHQVGGVNPDPNDIRAMTNDPAFPEQAATLDEVGFKGLTKFNHFKSAPDAATHDWDHFLPGDSSSGSRFIRVSKLLHAADEVYKPRSFATYPKIWRVLQANRIMARAEVISGEYPEELSGWPLQFHTIFTVIRDHTNRNLYFRGVYNPTLKKLDLMKLFSDSSKANNFFIQPVDPSPDDRGYKLIQYQDAIEFFQSNSKAAMRRTFKKKAVIPEERGFYLESISAPRATGR